MSKNTWMIIAIIVVGIAAYYAGKTGFWGMTVPKIG